MRPLRGSGAGREPRPLSESLDQVARRIGGPSGDVLSRIFAGWAALVGPSVAAHARPVSLVDGRLVVAVDDPAWATQLRYLSSDLRARLEGLAGAGAVTEITVRVEGAGGARRGRGKTTKNSPE